MKLKSIVKHIILSSKNVNKLDHVMLSNLTKSELLTINAHIVNDIFLECFRSGKSPKIDGVCRYINTVNISIARDLHKQFSRTSAKRAADSIGGSINKFINSGFVDMMRSNVDFLEYRSRALQQGLFTE